MEVTLKHLFGGVAEDADPADGADVCHAVAVSVDPRMAPPAAPEALPERRFSHYRSRLETRG